VMQTVVSQRPDDRRDVRLVGTLFANTRPWPSARAGRISDIANACRQGVRWAAAASSLRARLASRPALMILDEPTAGMDVEDGGLLERNQQTPSVADVLFATHY